MCRYYTKNYTNTIKINKKASKILENESASVNSTKKSS